MLPTGAAFDVVLLLHVAAVLFALGTVLASGIQARRLLAGTVPDPSGYFTGEVNWAGRVLYLVPALGVTLLALSHGAYGLRDGWVQWGIGLWAVAILGAELVLWPAERRVGTLLAGPAPQPAEIAQACRRTALAAAALTVVLVVGMVVMVAQP